LASLVQTTTEEFSEDLLNTSEDLLRTSVFFEVLENLSKVLQNMFGRVSEESSEDNSDNSTLVPATLRSLQKSFRTSSENSECLQKTSDFSSEHY